ncbi:hypothetical protein P4_00009 [Xanthomonas phage P4]|uniref:Uncharacterized protein n=1 Tax=Xanthomonas phage P4 TaxID=3003372 RepID=A0AAE9VI06_9CAUD|nr:hypothetical protein P4_00009 [Xanthomonas phage P4]
MASHFRLFGRPLSADDSVDALSVTGSLPYYVETDAYEGRLSINNSVGKCRVEVLSSTLPDGAFVRVDNISHEVVIKWDAFEIVAPTMKSVPNGDFELGEDGWSLGEGWSIGTGAGYDTYSGTHSARFADVSTKGSDLVLKKLPAKVNDYIRATVQINQGGSSRGNAGARISLIYMDVNNRDLLRLNGNLVTSGKRGAWHQSVVEGGAPAGTRSVILLVSAYRNKENKPLWVDDVQWNHSYQLGTADAGDIQLSLKVTDSLNRVAYWTGTIKVYAKPVWDGSWVQWNYPNTGPERQYLITFGKAGSKYLVVTQPYIYESDLPTSGFSAVNTGADAGAFAKNGGIIKMPNGSYVFLDRYPSGWIKRAGSSTWERIAANLPFSSGLAYSYSAGLLYCMEGINVRTSSNGDTWESFDATGIISNSDSRLEAVEDGNTGKFYLAVTNSAATGFDLYTSTDALHSWTKIDQILETSGTYYSKRLIWSDSQGSIVMLTRNTVRKVSSSGFGDTLLNFTLIQAVYPEFTPTSLNDIVEFGGIGELAVAVYGDLLVDGSPESRLVIFRIAEDGTVSHAMQFPTTSTTDFSLRPYGDQIALLSNNDVTDSTLAFISTAQ